MMIELSSIFVDDQDMALAFYTKTLGFVKKNDIPIPPGADRWLTVVSPEEPEGTELVLEPDSHPASKRFQSALYEAGIPLTAFVVEDIQAEYERLTKLGVVFSMGPTDMGSASASKTSASVTSAAVFDDTCGNLIQICQVG